MHIPGGQSRVYLIIKPAGSHYVLVPFMPREEFQGRLQSLQFFVDHINLSTEISLLAAIHSPQDLEIENGGRVNIQMLNRMYY